MTTPRTSRAPAALAALALLLFAGPAAAADHNDPNAVNSIFSDVAVERRRPLRLLRLPQRRQAPAARRWSSRSPSPRCRRPASSTPTCSTGVLVDPDPRGRLAAQDDHSLDGAARVRRRGQATRYVALEPAEVRVKVRRRTGGRRSTSSASPAATSEDRRDQQVRRSTLARRRTRSRSSRRPRRRLLQRPAGVLPLDQLRAAVLQGAAGAHRPARAADPEDAARARRQHALQLRPREPAARRRASKLDLPAGPLTLERRPLREGRATATTASSTAARTRRPGATSTPSSWRCRSPSSPGRPRTTASSTPGARAGCSRRRSKIEAIPDDGRSWPRAPRSALLDVARRARRRAAEVQARRHRRRAVRRRRA